MGPAKQTVIQDVACTVCACVCDDLTLLVQNNRIVQAQRACHLAEQWFLDQDRTAPPPARIQGQPSSLDAAIAKATSILGQARYPLIYGLSRSSTDGQRAAVALADLLGGTIDTTASEGHAPSVLALQQVGESTCSLGEVRHRADLVIFWGANPVQTHPRHLERYSLYPKGEQLPRGRADRTMVMINSGPCATDELADIVLQVPLGKDYEVIWALRQLIQGQTPAAHADVGLPTEQLVDLAQRMKSCRYGVVFFGYGLARQPLGHRVVEALLQLTIELNAFTRFQARRLRVLGDVAGADNVLCWQTGYPFSVNFSSGVPRYNPGEFSAGEMLARGEPDAALFLGADRIEHFPRAALPTLQSIPTILLAPPSAAPLWEPTVRIPTAVYGVHRSGTAYRMDDVPVPLKPCLSSTLPSDAEVLSAIREQLRQQATATSAATSAGVAGQ
jgi:formylmethanofuran dehydrogenase subunit B